MAHTLAEIWRDRPGFFDGKSFRQVISMSGDGCLKDGSQTCVEVRAWLGVIPLARLRRCADECLTDGFEGSGHALQDVVNELGVRLGFRVTPGRYRGVKNAAGNDGLWVGDDGYCLLIESKTTDAYRVHLDTIAGYRERLIAERAVTSERSSILIVVGRQDTGDLEVQVRGSRHAWDVRLISVGALLRLAEVKERINDWETSTRINLLLRPVEYTNLDRFVELLFAAKQDLETAGADAESRQASAAAKAGGGATGEIEAVREAMMRRLAARLSMDFVRQGRALWSAGGGRTRLVCLASQPREGPRGSRSYWYGFTPSQRAFLRDAESGYVVLVCGDSGRAFLVIREEFFGWLPELSTTQANPPSQDRVQQWHIIFNDYGERVELMRAGGGDLTDLSEYLIAEEE